MKKFLLGLALSLSANMAIAATQTWDFTDTNNFDINGNTYGNELNYNDNNGVDLAATAWADTNEVTTDVWGKCRFMFFTFPCITSSSTTEYIEEAKIDSNNYGLLTYNKDESALEHTVDNFLDYDMILLSFSQAVNISEIVLGWAFPDGDISLATFNDLPTLAGETWQSVANAATNTWSFSGTIGNQTIDVSTETNGIESQYWLVGAYNNVFETLNDCFDHVDAVKIAGITTSTSTSNKPTPVPEPASIMLLLAGLIGLFARQKRLL
ncbi:PEP-CTERM sorting domain-containing protein [Catenovulum sp. 2E275]|uniref:exosortase-dependent surface protein XDP1 n=1 Tax=Catenovulum sp. 2E275 TaxID=2980497 RepID=UPI0021CDF132|nr:exosortase-dependent surface protein XDP1 [Catenovulum sp. 2E275]MCU4674332.1 PEP-CTERM sorting domain-containing protein [Catenovulum sp. 2E275]